MDWKDLISPALTLAVLLVSVGRFRGKLDTSLEFMKQMLEEMKSNLKQHIEDDRVNFSRLWTELRDTQAPTRRKRRVR